MKRDFEQEKEALMKEVRSVLDEVEGLYQSGVERSSEETQALKGKLQDKLAQAQQKLADFEANASEQFKHRVKQADAYVQEKPYYAMGFAALAGLVVGVLLNRR
ncbi:MAG: DUF883 family protein [Neisseria sp.]|nr:DUF883 family protein [Neisseria sp.]